MSNRAECLLRQERYFDAQLAANDTLRLDSTCVKARVRRCKAGMAMVTNAADDKSQFSGGPPSLTFICDLSQLALLTTFGVAGVPNLAALSKEVKAASNKWHSDRRAPGLAGFASLQNALPTQAQ